MNKQATLQAIQDAGLLAVLRGPSKEVTLKMVDALREGGVIGIEITYTTPNAPEVVQALADRFGNDLILGMGTLTEVHQAQEAVDAGATFLVSPHCETELAHSMTATGVPVMMGALTPAEVAMSYKLGSDVVKLFPGSLGGPGYMKTLKGPFPDIPMMPTGGVNKDNAKAWFDAGAIAVGAGSTLCPTHLAVEGKFSEITAIAKDFMQSIEDSQL
jgi:2-dehydro-3-deoxyphosphogluconate aldolase / (4S)-4-hydroxy-2-oxoglutarate aldolase